MQQGSRMVAAASFAIYRLLSRLVVPVALQWRRLRGFEHPVRWPERLGKPSAKRPSSSLLWFHAVSLGEAMAVLPVICHCLHSRRDLAVLLTTTTLSSFEAIKDILPDNVIHQFAPLDCPAAVERFLLYWKPDAIFLTESELWPNLISCATDKKISVSLLNARISLKSYRRWSFFLSLPLIAMMLSKLRLIIPLSTLQAIRLQLLHASPSVIHFAGDLKFAVSDFIHHKEEAALIKTLREHVSNKSVWLAASIHRGEEEVILRVHEQLSKIYARLLLVLVIRHPTDRENVMAVMKEQKINFSVRSSNHMVSPNISVYLVDTLGELRLFYKISPVAVIGGSFLPSLAGHNISEAAAAGCALLTGPHVGHFDHMLRRMQQINNLSVKQVAGEEELLEEMKRLLGDPEYLEARQRAAREVHGVMAAGVVGRVWDLISAFALSP